MRRASGSAELLRCSDDHRSLVQESDRRAFSDTLLPAQRHARIDTHGAARRDIAGRQRD